MKKYLALPLAAAFALVACDNRPRRAPPQKPSFSHQTESYLMSSEDFDLQTVIGLVQDNKVSNAKELEEAINSDSGINNVDLDGDGQIDYILVKEDPDNPGTLTFHAVPSKTQSEADSQLVATTSVKRESSGVTVSGGYPSYVNGHDSNYYSYHRPGLSVGDVLFLAWALDVSRPRYVPLYRPHIYTPRPYLRGSALSSRRSTYRTTNKITTRTINKTKAPKSFKSSKAMTRAKSKYSSSKLSKPSGKKAATWGSKKGQSSTLKARDRTKPKQKATGFGAKKTPKKSSGWGSSSSKKKKSSGWGSSSPKKKSSGWGSSSSGRRKSSGWGGGSRSRGRRR